MRSSPRLSIPNIEPFWSAFVPTTSVYKTLFRIKTIFLICHVKCRVPSGVTHQLLTFSCIQETWKIKKSFECGLSQRGLQTYIENTSLVTGHEDPEVVHLEMYWCSTLDHAILGGCVVSTGTKLWLGRHRDNP